MFSFDAIVDNYQSILLRAVLAILIHWEIKNERRDEKDQAAENPPPLNRVTRVPSVHPANLPPFRRILP